MVELSRSRISLVMATWNGAAHLRPQLHSLFNQTLPPAELIACDDASTDETVQFLLEFAKVSPFPVRVFRRTSRIGYARNFEEAAGHATGDLLVFADQDDLWHSRKIEHIAHAAQSFGSGVLCHDFEVFESGGDVRLPSFFAHLESEGLPRAICVKGCAMAVDRRFIDQWGWPPPASGVSHDFWFAFLASVVGQRGFVNERLIRHRLHDHNASGWIPGAADRVPELAAKFGTQASGPVPVMLELFLKPGRRAWVRALRDVLRERAAPDQVERATHAIALLDIVARWLSPKPSETARSSA